MIAQMMVHVEIVITVVVCMCLCVACLIEVFSHGDVFPGDARTPFH